MGLTTLRRKNSLMEKFYSNTMLEWGRKNSLKEESVQEQDEGNREVGKSKAINVHCQD